MRLPFIILLILYTVICVRAAWKFSKKQQRDDHDYQNDAANYGPNVCAIQEVFRTGQKFYPDCVKKRLKKVCGTPTFLRYECCCGFGALEGEEGCPALLPLKNIIQTLSALGLTQFPKLLTNTELQRNLEEKGAFTVFAPIDGAFNKLTHDQKQRVFPWTYNALSLLHYHVIPGWHHSDHMKNTDLLPSLYYGMKPVLVNRISKNYMLTVNCARMVRSNILASNGVIHLIDQVLNTFDMFGNLTDVMFRESSQFSQFIQVLYTSELFPTLRERGPFTIFAPNNYAFSRLPPLLLERIMREQITAEAVVLHHTAPGIFCSTANVDVNTVKMLDGARMKFECKRSGQYIQNSKIVQADILAGNGVIHITNKLQLPSNIQTLEMLARELHLTKYLQLCHDAGLLDKLQSGTETTLFVPSDAAFNDLPKDRKQELQNEPTTFEAIFDYLTSIGKIRTDNFVGDHGIIMNSGNILKISVYRDGILMDNAEIISPNNECGNGVIHIIDTVLSPPVNNLLEIIKDAEDLSIFKKGLEYAKLASLLSSSNQTLTVFAPIDQAFSKMPTGKFDKIFDSPDTVKMLMLRHIVEQFIVDRVISSNSMLRLKTLQTESLTFQRGKSDEYKVDKVSEVFKPAIIASNGVLYKINQVLECQSMKEPS